MRPLQIKGVTVRNFGRHRGIIPLWGAERRCGFKSLRPLQISQTNPILPCIIILNLNPRRKGWQGKRMRPLQIKGVTVRLLGRHRGIIPHGEQRDVAGSSPFARFHDFSSTFFVVLLRLFSSKIPPKTSQKTLKNKFLEGDFFS